MSRLFLTLAVVLGIADFAIFLVAASLLGGDAINGAIKDGHYFLSQHGQATEVSASVYRYSCCTRARCSSPIR